MRNRTTYPPWPGLARLALLVLLPATLGAQPTPRHPELGRPLIRNWTMRDYAAFPQNWAARRDAEGRIYFGNRDGVLMYDGQAWRVLPMPGVFVRGIDFAADGRLYAGAIDELGYFERTALGEWGPYVSLRDQLPPEERATGDIRAVYALPDAVYFATDKRLLRWRDGQFHVWHFEGDWNVFTYRAHDRLYLHRMEAPLRVVEGDALAIASDRPDVQAARLAAVLPWDDDGLLLVWPRGDLAVLRHGVLTPWAAESRPWLSRQTIHAARRLDGGIVALMTERNGIVLFDASGAFLQRVDVAAGLYNPIVRDVLRDAEGGLWLAMNHGVAHVDALAGFTLFDAQNGLGRSTVRAVARHEGAFYAATAEGLFQLETAQDGTMARFAFVPGSEGESYALHSHRSGLLVAGRAGVTLVPAGGGPRQRITDGLGTQLIARPGDPDALWLSGGSAVYPLIYDGGRWRLGEPLPAPRAEPRTLAELPDGSIWASTPTRGLLRWPEPGRPAEAFFETAGLPPRHGWMRIDRWRDQLLVSSSLGLFRWQAEARRFEPFPVVGAQPDEGSRNLYGGDPDHLWSFWGRNRLVSHLIRLTPEGAAERLPQAIVQAIGDIETLWREQREGREILWVGGSFGLARVDLAEAFGRRADFSVVFGAIGHRHEPAVRDGLPVWKHGAADLAVHFAATTYRSGSNLQFQTRLEGYDRDWQPWSASASRDFTNLAAGRYTLRVRARDADGHLGREATLAFAVLPPWWQTIWAWLAFATGAVLLIYGLVRWRARAGERERARLQQLVAERTCQLVESQRNLLQAKEAAETANRAKSAFLASMSHELRTPLNSVLGYAQILQRSAEIGPAARRILNTIQRSGDHLLHLINEVLDLAKVEAGRIELHEAPLALGRFADSITDLFAVRAMERGLEFHAPAENALPVTVVADESRLRQVLLNLLGNAFKFTERGRIDWSITPAADGRWRFEVSDTGIGISAKEQARIFEPFYQSASKPTLAVQGTGLGLSISAHLVQLMGGQLQVASRPGHGARFWFEIPLPTVAVDAPATSTAAEESAAIVGYRGRRRRLLVIDDERANRAILEEMLSPLGFIIEPADGAEAARAAVARQAPDAVLLDLRMPGDDGFTLAREWRANGALLGAKVLALSASVLPEQQAEAIAAGCDAFLGKPFREEQLLRVIGSLLELDWLHSVAPEGSAAAEANVARVEEPIRWEAGVLPRLLQLAERGDALRLGNELAELARRGAAWAALVGPWQKLAVGYQMEALSRVLEEALQEARGAETS